MESWFVGVTRATTRSSRMRTTVRSSGLPRLWGGPPQPVQPDPQIIRHDFGGHCCIERSVHPSWSACPPRSHVAALRMPGLLWFSKASEGSASLLRCRARAPFALMQQCPRYYVNDGKEHKLAEWAPSRRQADTRWLGRRLVRRHAQHSRITFGYLPRMFSSESGRTSDEDTAIPRRNPCARWRSTCLRSDPGQRRHSQQQFCFGFGAWYAYLAGRRELSYGCQPRQLLGPLRNTAAWMDCTGGSEKSWVRLGYNRGIPPVTRFHHTKWVVISPGEKKTSRAECNVRVNKAWTNIRPY
jgi:hypothetical protein